MSKPVIAAIPHYNMSESLLPLLAQTADPEQGYDEIVVIDDGSTEEHTTGAAEAAEAFGATFRRNSTNRGPAAARNSLVFDSRYRDTVLHFLDADVSLETAGNAYTAREMVADKSIGMVGGLILDKDGHQAGFNYGPAFTLKSAVGFAAQMRVAELARRNEAAAAKWRHRLSFLLRAWPDTTNVTPAEAAWVAEANMVVDRNLFAAIGGFSESVRFHDIVTPAVRMAHLGLKVLFDPSIAVTHHDLGNHANRPKEQAEAVKILIRRHGLRPFLFGGDRTVGDPGWDNR